MAPAHKPKTILFVHNSNDLYGAEVILLHLIQALDPARYRAVVALPEDVRHIDRFSVRLQEAGIPFVFLPLGIMRRKYLKPLRLLPFLTEVVRGTWCLRSLVKHEHVDLVHSNTLSVVSGAFAAKITGRPHIWHIHEFLTTHPPLRRLLHWTAVRLSDRIVTVSYAVRGHILRDQPKAASMMQTIHNGIDLSSFLSSEGGDLVRREFDVPASAIVIGMVGRVSRWKGQSLFVEAAKQVLARFPDAYFVAVGGVFDDEHHHMTAFHGLVQSYGLKNFRISDFRSDIPQVLASFDLFVLPSIEPDPFPTVIVEAMASGRAVVGANHGGVPEMIEDEETGLLFEPRDSDDLAQKILMLLDDQPRLREMGHRSRERALHEFQVARFADEFQALYDQLLGE